MVDYISKLAGRPSGLSGQIFCDPQILVLDLCVLFSVTWMFVESPVTQDLFLMQEIKEETIDNTTRNLVSKITNSYEHT